jgi:aspartate kinase
MNLKPTVQKFGGSSLEDAQAFDRVGRLIWAGQAAGTVIVASAMRGVTDALLESARLAEELGTDIGVCTLAPHLDRHTDVARALLSPPSIASAEAKIEAARADITKLLESLAARLAPRAPLLDEIVSYGELLSTALLAAVLREKGLPAREVDARRCIITDDAYGCATPMHDATMRHTRAELEPLLNSLAIPVLGGFIASSTSGATTSLGRNGSDYTAALVGAALSAEEIQIWTDVAGILTADPRLVADARTVRHLSYAEAEALAYFGAKVLCPKAIQPLVGQGIPLRVCNSLVQGGETTVSASAQASRLGIKAIAHKEGVAIVHAAPAHGVAAYKLMRPLFELLERHCAVVDIATASGTGVSLTLSDADRLSRIRAELEPLGPVRVEEDRAIICVVGEGLCYAPRVSGQVFDLLDEMEIRLVEQGASRAGLLFVIEAARVGEAVARLHESFFGNAGSSYEALEVRRPEKAVMDAL